MKRINKIRLLLMICLGLPLAIQAQPKQPPQQERDADIVLRMRVLEATTQETDEKWPEIIRDLKKTLTSTGRYDTYNFIEGSRIPLMFDKSTRVQIKKEGMVVELTIQPENKGGNPITVNWIQGKKKILERRGFTLNKNKPVISVYQADQDSLPVVLVVDLAPAWEKDPLVNPPKKKTK